MFENDITYCAFDSCPDLDCLRNLCNRKKPNKGERDIFTVADFRQDCSTYRITNADIAEQIFNKMWENND